MADLEPRKIWWTAREIAEASFPDLPGSERGINAIATRQGWMSVPDCIRRRPGRGGGVLYHWSLLPETARRRLLREALEGKPEEKPGRAEAWNRFDALPAKTKDEAKMRLGAIQLADRICDTGVTRHQAMATAAAQCNVNVRTLYNWLELIEGVAPEDRLAYLARRNRTAERKSTKATCTKAFKLHLNGLYLRLEQPSFKECWRLAKKKAEAEGWEFLTEKTAWRHLQKEVPYLTRVLARKGEAGLMRAFPAQIRDREGLHAMEGVNADCHKIDVFVSWPDGTINRPQIVVFQDLYSGKILSWRVDHSPNKVMVMSAFGEMIENWGIPKRCLFDNGHEFANKWMTGGTNTRFRFKVLDDDPRGVMDLMGIKVHWATPGHGQAKPVERAFGDWAQNIAKDPRCHGAYVGNKPSAKPENYGERAINMDTFLSVVAEGVAEHNAREGRLSPTAKGRSFDQTFAESYGNAPILKATEEQRRLWLLCQQVCKLNQQNGQIRLYGNYYHSDWMSQHPGQRVVARFDPDHLHAGLEIYSTDGEHLGFAECRQKVGFFDLSGAKEQARKNRRRKKIQKELLQDLSPVSIEEIAAGMSEQSVTPAPVPEAKVVSLKFGQPNNPPRIRRPHSVRPADPKLDAAREALILSMPENKKDEPRKPDGVFRPENDPDARFARAQEILNRSEEGKPVGTAEADWLSDYLQSVEYKSAKMMADMLRNQSG